MADSGSNHFHNSLILPRLAHLNILKDPSSLSILWGVGDDGLGGLDIGLHDETRWGFDATNVEENYDVKGWRVDAEKCTACQR
jgi:hypothetical protein